MTDVKIECHACNGSRHGKSYTAFEDCVRDMLRVGSASKNNERLDAKRFTNADPGSAFHHITAGLAGRAPGPTGHDAIDAWNAMERIASIAGVALREWDICTVCNGSGDEPTPVLDVPKEAFTLRSDARRSARTPASGCSSIGARTHWLNTKWAALTAAIDVANSGTCAKSRRGVVIWRDDRLMFSDSSAPPGVRLISSGFNAPPGANGRCLGNDLCKEVCSSICVHAEQSAIVAAMRTGIKLDGACMLHVKTVNEYGVAGGPPSCVECSKLILESGIAFMYLVQPWTANNGHHNRYVVWDRAGFASDNAGLVRYEAHEFHRLSLMAKGLPVFT